MEPEAWYRGLPPVTRVILTSVFATTCLVQFGLLDPYILILDWQLVSKSFQIWRPFTAALFVGKFSFAFVMSLYFISSFGGKLERNDRFSSSPADFVFFLLFITITCAAMSSLLAWPSGYPLTGTAVVFAMIYYWSRCEPEARLSIYGFEVKGYQLPFAMMLLTVLMGGDVWTDLLGLGAGHLYYFLKDVVPLEYGWRLLGTPRWFMWMYAKCGKSVRVNQSSAARSAVPLQPRLFGGQGNRLGRD